MKLTNKLSLVAIAATLTLASSAFAGDQSNRRVIWSIQPGNGQSVTIVYEQKPVTTVALRVSNASVGAKTSAKTRYNAQGQNGPQVTISNGIN